MKRVAVIGGGVAGCAAAVAAAEAGHQVTLLEAGRHLGGVAARGEHRTLCGLAPIDADAPDLLEADLTAAWVAALACGKPWKQGRVWLWPTTAEAIVAGCVRRLAAAGVSHRIAAPVDNLHLDGQRLIAVEAAGVHLAVDAVIDASGGSAIAALGGWPRREPEAWGSLRVVLGLAAPEGLSARGRLLRRLHQILGPAHLGLAAIDGSSSQLSVDVASGAAVGCEAARIGEALDVAGIPVLATTASVADRDAGGWAGDLDAEALFLQAERGWCWAAWPMEAHGPQGTEWRWPLRDRYGLPHDLVHPSGAPTNLRVVGRGGPMRASAVAALRVTGTQLALGTAVGRSLTRPT